MKDNSLYCLGILELGILFLIGTEGFLTNEVQISLSHLKLLISFNFANFIGNEIECGRYLMSSESYGLPVTNLIHYEVSDLKVTFLTPLMKVKEESEKVGLKLNVQKTKTLESYHFMANRWRNSGNSGRLGFLGGAPKSLQMVIAAMKLKDAYSLEEKL